ncbi:hypothetical protein HMPREF1254_1318 [Prevotella sp. BV3P1]|nr:hypothetical protein HMPREF1254_1318 [Prevotella sp. BV3P1]
MQPILCKNSANRKQRKFTFYVKVQPIFCKITTLSIIICTFEAK